MNARRYPLLIATGLLLTPLARGQGAAPPPAQAPANPVQTPAPPAAAPETPPSPAPTGAMPDAPTPAPPPDPNAAAPAPGSPPAAAPAPQPEPTPSPAPTMMPPPAAPLPPGIVGTQIATPADTRAEGAQGVPPPPPSGLGLGIELGVGMAAGGRFADSAVDELRTVEEAVDSTYGAAVWLGSRRVVGGLAFERIGLGRDHYATNVAGETMTARYGADALSLLGRWYFADVRPALFLGASIGAAVGTVHATGTHAPDGVFVTPGASYECSSIGRVGGTASLSFGAEFEIVKGLAVVTDARVTGLLLSNSSDTFGGCAPGTGPALVGVLRLGASYRFDL